MTVIVVSLVICIPVNSQYVGDHKRMLAILHISGKCPGTVTQRPEIRQLQNDCYQSELL